MLVAFAHCFGYTNPWKGLPHGGRQVRFMGHDVRYDAYTKTVDCKGEGNILVVENEEKGDVHFCKIGYNKEGHFPAESRNYESNDIIRQNCHRGGNLRQEESDRDCKIDL